MGAGRRSRSKDAKARRRRSPSDRKKRRSPSDKPKRPSPKARSRSRSAGKQSKRRPSPKQQSKKQRASPSPTAAARQRSSPSPLNPRRSRSGSRSASANSTKAAPSGTKPAAFETRRVTFEERPFGMAPSKAAEGYVVEKVADDKPAGLKGVQQGWKIVEINGRSCEREDSKAIQELLKSVSLPVDVTFAKPADEKIDEESDNEMGELQGMRADAREKNAAALASIDSMPVSVSPEQGLPEALTGWQDACDRKILNVALVKKLQAAGLKKPTPIQRHALPIIAHQPESYDVIAQAQTGSGKTFAFVIPTIGKLVMHGASARPFFAGSCGQPSPLVLILSPTRELATQTATEIEILTKGTNLTHMAIYGGEHVTDTQKKMEKAQIDIVVGCPGRLITLIDSSKLSLAFVQTVVVDEADQMLKEQMELVCKKVLVERDMPTSASGRQTLLFSATVPAKIRALIPELMREHRTASLTVGHYGDGHGGSCKKIKQIIKRVDDDRQRIWELSADLKQYWVRAGKKGRVVIFSNTRSLADSLTQTLQKEGFACRHLHGKLEQTDRDEVFSQFRLGTFDVLVATNVASRGLDFPDISLVVQFHLPADIDTYTHRIGRTGRSGTAGCALAYIGRSDSRLMPKLREFLELNKQEIPSCLRENARSRSRDRGRAGYGGGYGKGGGKGGYGKRY